MYMLSVSVSVSGTRWNHPRNPSGDPLRDPQDHPGDLPGPAEAHPRAPGTSGNLSGTSRGTHKTALVTQQDTPKPNNEPLGPPRTTRDSPGPARNSPRQIVKIRKPIVNHHI